MKTGLASLFIVNCMGCVFNWMMAYSCVKGHWHHPLFAVFYALMVILQLSLSSKFKWLFSLAVRSFKGEI